MLNIITNVIRIIHSFIIVMRPQFWFRALGPAIAGGLLASNGSIPPDILLRIVLTIICLVAGAKSLNDYYDRQYDKLENIQKVWGINISGGSGIIQAKKLTSIQVLLFSLSLFLFSFVISITINPLFIMFTILGILFGVLYSVPPFRLKNRGIAGGVIRSLSYCFVAFNLGWIAITSQLDLFVLSLGLIMTICFFGLEEIGNILDYDNDLTNSIKTFPIQFGLNNAGKILAICQILPLIILIILSAINLIKIDLFLISAITIIVVPISFITLKYNEGILLNRTRFFSLFIQGLLFLPFI